MAYRTPKHVQEKKDAKREHILDSAFKIFADKGFHETSTRDICREAGVSTGSLYSYFPSKESIYEAVYDKFLADAVGEGMVVLDGVTDVKEFIEKSTRTLVGFMTSDAHLIKFMHSTTYQVNSLQKIDDIIRGGTVLFKRVLDEAIRRGGLRPVNTELAAATFVVSVYNLVRYYNFNECQFDKEEMTEFLINNALRGLGMDC